MISDLTSEKPNINGIITHFASTIPHLLEVKLDKLIYIAHLYHYSNYGELLTHIRFFSLSFGPHAPILRLIINELVKSGAIYLIDSRTSTDSIYSNPCKIIKANNKKYNLSIAYQNTLMDVEKDWGGKSFNDILDYTTRTIPYLSTDYRTQIDWKRIPLFRDLRSILSLNQRIQIHKFVNQTVNGPMYFNSHEKGSWPVSINEIAEINLAIRGNNPEEIPSKGSLGFDIVAVVSALRKVGKKYYNGIAKYLTAIEGAACLAILIMESMSFKIYSGRVALISGLLCMKKSGYSFNGDILEYSWPEGEDLQSIKKWFENVSFKIEAE